MHSIGNENYWLWHKRKSFVPFFPLFIHRVYIRQRVNSGRKVTIYILVCALRTSEILYRQIYNAVHGMAFHLMLSLYWYCGIQFVFIAHFYKYRSLCCCITSIPIYLSIYSIKCTLYSKSNEFLPETLCVYIKRWISSHIGYDGVILHQRHKKNPLFSMYMYNPACI